MRIAQIDGGKAFDWGKTSEDYAKFRDVYPEEFYQKIVQRGLCMHGQSVLDVGTGTGVLPRNLYRYGAKWVGTDISENQIFQAKRLSEGMNIEYQVLSAENLEFPDHSFDVITACQCFWYFNHQQTAQAFYRMLKPGGRLLFLYMSWLPFEDPIAQASEKLVLQHNPQWGGKGETVHPISIPAPYNEYFEIVSHEEYPLEIAFTRESWNGRIKACRGVGASLSEQEVAAWEKEHRELLANIAPESFTIAHYGAITELKRREKPL